MNDLGTSAQALRMVFGPFELDPGRYLLSRNGYRIELPRIAMEILLVLVARPGMLVTRSQLVAVVWPGVDSEEKEQSVNTAINRIRGALRDDPTKPKYVETIIGKGYRFIAPITSGPRDDATETSDDTSLSSTMGLVADVSVAAGTDNASAESGAVQPYPEIPAQLAPAETETIDIRAPLGSSLARHRLPGVAIASLVVLVGLATAAWFWKSHFQARPADSKDFRLAAPVELTGNYSENLITTSSISPDASRVVFADGDGLKLNGRHDLAPVKLAPLELRSVDHIAWFGDGDRLIVSGLPRSGDTPEVWITSASGTIAPHLLRSDAQAGLPSADGTHVLFLSDNNHELAEINTDGKNLRIILNGSAGVAFADPTLLPGGTYLLLQRSERLTEKAVLLESASTPRKDQNSSIVVRMSDGTVVSSQPGLKKSSPVAYHDGTVLFVYQTAVELPLATLKVDLRTGAFIGTPQPVARASSSNIADLSAALNGDTALLLQSGSEGVFVAELANSGDELRRVRPLTSPTQGAFTHAWSPDSRSVLFERYRDGNWYLMSQDVTQTDAEPLGGAPQQGMMAIVSPDRKWYLFTQQKENSAQPQLFRAPLGKKPPTETTRMHAKRLDVPPGDVRCPRTGTLCILRTKDAQHRSVQLLSLDVASGKTQKLRDLPWEDASFGDWDVSPDGKQVVLSSGPNEPGELHLLSLNGQGERVLAFPVYSPFQSVNWQASGIGWFASSSSHAGSILYHLRPDGKATALRNTMFGTWAVPSPNGKAIAFQDLNQDRNVWITHPENLHTR